MTKIVTASRRDVAAFLRLVRKNGGAVNAPSFRKEATEGQVVAADRALNEQLVRGFGARGHRFGDPDIANAEELHLTTAGEKFLKNWSWRWWRWLALTVGLFVGAESCVSVVLQVLEALP